MYAAPAGAGVEAGATLLLTKLEGLALLTIEEGVAKMAEETDEATDERPVLPIDEEEEAELVIVAGRVVLEPEAEVEDEALEEEDKAEEEEVVPAETEGPASPPKQSDLFSPSASVSARAFFSHAKRSGTYEPG